MHPGHDFFQPSSASARRGKILCHTAQITFCLFLILAGFIYSRPQTAPAANAVNQVKFTDSNLPIILIDTFGAEIVDEVRIKANMKIIDNGAGRRNHITDPPNNYNGRIEIELRGSATLAYPKKGYRLETQDALGENLNVALLGMPKENDWVFYGPYDDQSLIRNVVAFELSNEIGRYASRTRFFELVLNNDYRGLYILMEKIKQDKNRIAITEMDATSKTGDAVTGGYIIKFDKESGENVGGWWSSRGLFYQYHEPKADEIITEQKNYIRGFMNQFETMMTWTVISDSMVGYPHYLEVGSFVDHFILSEFCKNIDAYRISFYMFKDRDSKGGKLNAGPIWDFNLSFGKTWYVEDTYRVDEWEIDHNKYKPNDWPKVPFWWEKLGHDREFAKHVRTRWAALKNATLQPDSVFRRIDRLVEVTAEARVRNFERWPETARAHTYEKEIQLFKQWITSRIAWMESHLDGLAAVAPTPDGMTVNAFQLQQNYPNPFNASTTIAFSLPGASWVTLKIFNLMGAELATILAEKLPAGVHQYQWQANQFASGIYMYRLEADGSVQTRKFVLLK